MKRSTFVITSLIVILSFFFLLATVFLRPTTWAQTLTHRMEMWVVAGGGESRSNAFTVNGIAGQPNAATSAQGPTYRVDGGFLPAAGIIVGPASAPNLYLPIVAQAPSPTPLPTATPTATPPPGQMAWQRLGQGGLEVSAIAVQGDTIFAADRRGVGEGGGLYRRTLVGCNLTEGWTRIETIGLSVLDVEFRENLGVAAAFGANGIFYSKDGGSTWTQTTNLPGQPRTVAIASDDGKFFTGTENNGVYNSVNGGITWSSQSPLPKFITVIALSSNTIWIGADQTTNGDTTNAGVWKLGTLDGTPTQVVGGLAEGPSRQVWDFLIRSGSEIYIATYNGVFRGDGITDWTTFGNLQGTELLSLATFQDVLYAGERVRDETINAGVWRIPLAGGAWERVPSGAWNNSQAIRDLLADPTHCNGLLAATEDGVWLYR